jgi:hypothetical protein
MPNKKVILCTHFFVVEGLAIPMLLGINWLYSQNSIINLQNKTLTFDIDKQGGRCTLLFKQMDDKTSYQEPPEFVFMCEQNPESENINFQNSPVDEFDLNDYFSEDDGLKIVDDDDYYLPKNSKIFKK